MDKLQSSGRRKALMSGLKAIGLTLSGSLVWSAFLNANTKNSLILRPPAAKEEREFLKNCIRCGLCVELCPYDTLKLANISDGIPLGTPYFEPRDIPCYMCEDIPCVPSCPTNALDLSLVSVKENGEDKLDIKKAKMGIAVVDTKHCIAYDGIRCEACYRACPLIGEAIVLELKRNERTAKHALFIPTVNNEVCTGCGKCERACVTPKASIFVLPPQIFGTSGEHYAKGWDEKDEQRLYQNQNDAGNQKPLSTKSAEDYLNSGEF
ncbi:MAG: ferredoxin-type protein NapG [Campylobacteraceae bacterium]|jgi:ferredoxin-type protein NapG|nr:ferredoxin-type protein NapG [Campylobacteraceae bacterium]